MTTRNSAGARLPAMAEKTSMSRLLQRLFCRHGDALEFVRNIHGDEVFEWGGKRSIWRCEKCGARVLQSAPNITPIVPETISDRWQAAGFSKDTSDSIEAAVAPPSSWMRTRDAAPALLAALRRTWEVIDAAGLQALTRGVELGPTVWFVKASDARENALAAIAEATGEERAPAVRPAHARTVESLQRELLAIARGGKFAESYAKVNGIQGSDEINLRAEIGNLSRILALREQIRAIDPDAALYYGWAGHGDIDPRRTAQHAAHMEETMRLFGPKEND